MFHFSFYIHKHMYYVITRMGCETNKKKQDLQKRRVGSGGQEQLEKDDEERGRGRRKIRGGRRVKCGEEKEDANDDSIYFGDYFCWTVWYIMFQVKGLMIMHGWICKEKKKEEI